MRRSIYLNVGLLAALVVLLGMSTALQATPIAPGGTLTPVTTIPDPRGAETLLADKTVAFATASFTGTVHSQVFDRDPGPGVLLDFFYIITNTSAFAGAEGIARVTMSDFRSAVLTDVNQSVLAVTDKPSLLADRSLNGATIGFQFKQLLDAQRINPGENSTLLLIRTDATTFETGTVGIIDGVTTNVDSFAPGPEPASIVLLGSSLLGLTVFARRRFRRG